MILSNPKPANTQQKQQRVGVSGIFHVPGCPVCVCLCFPSLHAQCHAADVFALRAQALLRAQHLNIPDLTHGASHLLTSTLNRGVSSPSSHGCNACKIVCVCSWAEETCGHAQNVECVYSLGQLLHKYRRHITFMSGAARPRGAENWHVVSVYACVSLY